MNTPAHMAMSVFIWSDEPGWPAAAAITVGAWLPDIPMFIFFAYQKLRRVDDKKIWSEAYYDPAWQIFFDIPNSFPLILAMLAICFVLGLHIGVLLTASAAIHLLCDFFLHHEDGHRHFLPFSSWRFFSPVSYWEPSRHGNIFFGFEILFVIATCSSVILESPNDYMRMAAITAASLYFVGVAISQLK